MALLGKAYAPAFGCIGCIIVIVLFVAIMWGLGVMAGPA